MVSNTLPTLIYIYIYIYIYGVSIYIGPHVTATNYTNNIILCTFFFFQILKIVYSNNY